MPTIRKENGNPNAPRPGMKRDAGFGTTPPTYERQSLDGSYKAWYTPAANTVLGNAFKSWSQSPNANPGEGTIHRQEDQAREGVNAFMDRSVPAQREERAGHTLPPDRIEYVDGELTILDTSAQYSRYFSAPEEPAQEPESVGGVVAIGSVGGFYLRRHKRLANGDLQPQYTDPEIETLLRPLYTKDIYANAGNWNWGIEDDGVWYPVAADVANAAFPQTYPPYEPRRLPQEEEAIVLRRRSAGKVGDPIAGQETPDERMERTMFDHLDGTSQAWNV